jgi:hypothetical protein
MEERNVYKILVEEFRRKGTANKTETKVGG